MASKKVLAFLVFLFAFATSRAQYVSIPDTNFRNFLMNDGFAGCMQGDSLDTTCAAVVSVTKINCNNKNIHDLAGIQYFDNLDTLICYENIHLSFLPVLPYSLTYLDCHLDSLLILPTLPITMLYIDCSANKLTSLLVLPSNLITLDCSSNHITTLPSLPSSLTTLQCAFCQLNSLPFLPSSIRYLDASQNFLSNLPTLPDSLEYFDCGYNQFTSLPILPIALDYFECEGNQLTFLPSLPNQLTQLLCGNNQLTSLPTLPSSIELLWCSHNLLSLLPSLPGNLQTLWCYFNSLSSLPVLPISLTRFDCSSNILVSVPSLPNNLYDFRCEHNQLQSLPALPISLTTLVCGYNFITQLPNLPNSVRGLGCNSNSLTSIPNFPDSLGYLDISNNPISCLPEIKIINNMRWDSTLVFCLPNIGRIHSSTPVIDTLPLCDPFSICPLFWNISGKVFFDVDSSCIQDTNEIGLKDISVVLDSGGIQLQQMHTDDYGNFSFQTGYGNYQLKVDTVNAPYHVVCPVAFLGTSTLTAIDSMDTGIDFGLVCNSGFDLTTRSISPLQMFRPGFQTTIYMNAGDGMSFSGTSCANGLSGAVQAIIDNLVSYVSPAAGALVPSSVNGDTITWNITDFSLIDPIHVFNIIVEVSTSANINDTICIELNVSPAIGDNIPSNNTLTECFPVVGSYDPNIKYMFPSGDVDTSQQWFEFTIFFQNVGTAPANDIYILDTLDQNLDATTFTYLSSSHDVITQLLPGSILRFNYPDINLADSTTDEPASHGYVKFKVKRNENLPVNTTITNTAHIFFDFNNAVVTNTTQAMLTTSVGMTENISNEIIIYPNPARSQLTIDSRQNTISSIEVLNMMGQKVYSFYEGKAKRQTIDVNDFSEGIYIMKINLENKIVVKRFIKQ
jgi:uncharacterized repeat protein (TIGR01451 family)